MMLLPVYSIILFCILYFIAASLYPGGSDKDKMSKGFSWLHNYWCELMAPHAQNGQINTARPVAITAMAVLTIGLIFFWHYAAFLCDPKSVSFHLTRYAGIASAGIWVFFLTGAHDTVINLSGLFGLIAIVTILVRLYKKGWTILFCTGLLCVVLCGINNYVYYANHFFSSLPVIQKISFVVFLFWFCGITIQLYRALLYRFEPPLKDTG